jgi:hypothetical protein
VKSAFLVSRTDHLVALAARIAQDWAQHDGLVSVDPDIDLVRITREGAGTMLIELLDGIGEFEWLQPLRDSGVSGPLSGYLVTCRDEHFFCCVVRSLALQVDFDVWVVDSDGSVFEASTVRPETIRL